MKRIAILITAVILLSWTVRDASAHAYERVLRLSDGKVINFSELIDELKGADVVFVGEIHVLPTNHQAQLDIISSLSESGSRLALGLEMFTANNQKVLDSWMEGKTSDKRFEQAYYDDWKFDWDYYDEIFSYSKRRFIPLVGLNVPREVTSKVARDGFSSLTAEDLKQLPAGLSCDVDAEYMEFIRRAHAAHGSSGKSFLYFCEAQMVWDKSMAWHILNYINEHDDDRTVVVLAGTSHAWKNGIPQQVRRQSKEHLRMKVVLPMVQGSIMPENITQDDADYLLLD